MNKKLWLKVFLPLLSLMAVVLATTSDSVTIYNIPTQTVQTCSYFSLVTEETVQLCTPFAAIMAVAALVLAVIYVLAEKRWSIRGVFYTALLSCFAATVPPLVRGDVIVVPHVLFPVLMAIVCLLAYSVVKQPKSEEPTATRLD